MRARHSARRFQDERACATYLAQARWPDGFRCPACGHGKGWELTDKAFTWECAGCGKQTSVRLADVRDDWTRPALVNEATRLYGRRKVA